MPTDSNAQRLIRSMRRRITGNRGAVHHKGLHLPPPELRAGGEHFQDDEAFVLSGASEARRLQRDFSLTADTRLLDIGCGAGRLPIGLLSEVGALSHYTGIDVSAEQIRWCRRYIERDYPGMNFVLLDAQNERYRPHGKKVDAEFGLPLADESFDVIYLYSVFSHMRRAEVEAYLREFARLLARSGGVFLTAFLEEGVPDERINPEGYLGTWQGPLHCVRFDHEFFARTVANAGLRIDRIDHRAETDGQSGIYLAHA
jgi:SAM-dependent methyltransferase